MKARLGSSLAQAGFQECLDKALSEFSGEKQSASQLFVVSCEKGDIVDFSRCRPHNKPRHHGIWRLPDGWHVKPNTARYNEVSNNGPGRAGIAVHSENDTSVTVVMHCSGHGCGDQDGEVKATGTVIAQIVREPTADEYKKAIESCR